VSEIIHLTTIDAYDGMIGRRYQDITSFKTIFIEIKIKKLYNADYIISNVDLNNLMMKIKVLFLLLVASMMGTAVKAQDDSISDEDLQKYVVAMDSIEHMKTHLIETITEMVKGNEDVSAARYNELSKIIDDEAKLKEAEANEVEIAFVKSVAAKKEEETAKINETFQSLALNYIGGRTYNAIKKALKEDETIKAKYKTLTEQQDK